MSENKAIKGGAHPVASPVRAVAVRPQGRLLEHRFALPAGHEPLVDCVDAKLLLTQQASRARVARLGLLERCTNLEAGAGGGRVLFRPASSPPPRDRLGANRVARRQPELRSRPSEFKTPLSRDAR